MKLFQLLLVAFFYSASATAAPLMVPAWKTENVFKRPESVIYHPATDSLIVSNIDGQPNEVDGNGFLSKVSISGEVITLHWLDGFDAPKGMAMREDLLYVADIDKLVIVDVLQQKIIKKITAEGAKFLNDIAIDDKANVYISDMLTNKIYRYKDNNLEIWIEDPMLENPNGLLVEQDQLIVGSWGNMTDGFVTEIPGHLKKIDIKSREIESLGNQAPVGNLDGVEADGYGNYFVTDWMNGRLLHILPNGSSMTLIALDQGSADHTVLPEYNLVVIPLMLNDQIIAFKVK